MMLIEKSNEPLEGYWAQDAELTPFLQKNSQPVALCLGVRNAVLAPPVEAGSQNLNQRLMVIGGNAGWRT